MRENKSGEFVSLLHQLDYPRKLSASSFEWAFKHPETRQVMLWLASQNLCSQVLATRERSQFEDLQVKGKELFGDTLDQAFKSAVSYEAPPETDSPGLGSSSPFKLMFPSKDIDSKISAFEREIQRLETEHNELLRQLSLLRQQTSSTRHRRQATSARASAAAQQLGNAKAEMTQLASGLESAMEELEQMCRRLEGLWAHPQALEAQGPPRLLSTCTLDDYVSTDIAFSRKLSSARPQAHAQPEDSGLTLQDGPVPCSSSEDKLSGQNGLHSPPQRELERLKHAVQLSQSQRIMAEAEEARRAAELDALQNAAAGCGVNGRLQSQEDEQELRRLQRMVPTLLARVARQKELAILEREYEAKLEREGRRFRQRTEHLRLALQQVAWHKVIELGLAIESDGAESLRSCLEASEQLLNRHCSASKRRCQKYRLLSGSSAPMRLTLRSDDTVLQGIAEVLSTSRIPLYGSRGSLCEGQDSGRDPLDSRTSPASCSQGYVEVAALVGQVSRAPVCVA
uniref:HAUS augmin-like complex subunit 3 N-terminal domain-containing protein n=1 Tax=Tetraselmis sp. GSL018 TaxID=582737 RepID=A0A061QPW3_9CHLO